MTDPNQAIRKAFYDALKSGLSVDSVSVPVFDEIADTNAKVYVVLSSQTSTDDSTFTHWGHDCTLLIDIIHKSDYGVSKDAVDEVASKVFAAIFPTKNTVGLVNPAGLRFGQVRVDADNYLSADSVIRRLIRFFIHVHEN